MKIIQSVQHAMTKVRNGIFLLRMLFAHSRKAAVLQRTGANRSSAVKV